VAWAAGGEVRTMAVNGTNDGPLTSGERFEYAPRFSPDGRALLVARREPDGTDAGWWVLPAVPGGPPERQVLQAGAPPLGSTELAGDGIEAGNGFPSWAGRAAWDRGGRWLLVTTGGGDVMLVDLEAEAPASAAIDTGLRATAAGAWSPAADRFAIVARGPAEATDGLYVVETDGTTRRVADAAGSVAVADDGDVAVLLAEGTATHVAVGDLDGDPAIAPLTSGAELADRWPTFSPDGETVLFGRVRTGGETLSAGIWTIQAGRGSPVALTTDGAYPRWLP
jgi:Tol biopolymer transport system component